MEILSSPFIGKLADYSLFITCMVIGIAIVWRALQKKDTAMMGMHKEYQDNMLTMQKEHIMATNNSADAQRQLATALTGFEARISDKIEELKPSGRNGKIRPLNAASVPSTPATA